MMRPCPYKKSGSRYRSRKLKYGKTCSDTVERLMRLVVAQGETIQTQLKRLNQRENQIETYEQQMHLLRVQSLGNDYLLSSYLQDQQSHHSDSSKDSSEMKGVAFGGPTREESRNLNERISSIPSNLILPPPKYRKTNLLDEKSNDSGIVMNEESSSSEDRTSLLDKNSSIESQDSESEMLMRLEEIITQLVHKEEMIHGLASTVEVMETQQKLEASELEEELKRVGEEHSLLVAEARANEQQIRVKDTSNTQKKKLIDALLQEEADSDQETRALQAHLDYIIHLPPTAFRLAKEGDDPPPLFPPPQYPPVCLVQPLVGHQPQQVNKVPSDDGGKQPLKQTIPPPPPYLPPPPPKERHNPTSPNTLPNQTNENSRVSCDNKVPNKVSLKNNRNNLLNLNTTNGDELRSCNCPHSTIVEQSNSCSFCIKCKLRSSNKNETINRKLNGNEKLSIGKEDVFNVEDIPPPLPLSPPPPLNDENINTITTKLKDDTKNNNSSCKENSTSILKRPLVSNTNNVKSALGNRSEAFIGSLPVKCRSSTSSDSSNTNSSTGVPSSIIKYPIKPILKNKNVSFSCVQQKLKEDSVDSNSDTGLSSLHSSSDEGFGTLDTLV